MPRWMIIITVLFLASGLGAIWAYSHNKKTITSGSFRELAIGDSKEIVLAVVVDNFDLSHINFSWIKSRVIELPSQNIDLPDTGFFSFSSSEEFVTFESLGGSIVNIELIKGSNNSFVASVLTVGDSVSKTRIAFAEYASTAILKVEPKVGSFKWLDVKKDTNELKELSQSADQWAFTLSGTRKHFDLVFDRGVLVMIRYVNFVVELP